MIVKGRWYYTDEGPNGELVPEGDVRAAFLAYPDGDEVGDAEAEKLNLKAKMLSGAASNKQLKAGAKDK